MLDTLTQLRPDWGAVTRVLIGMLILFAMVVGPSVYGAATSGERVAPALEGVDGPVNVQVSMSFKPSAFHQQELSQYGIFGGIQGKSVLLFNVTPRHLEQLGRIYWLDSIVPFQRR